MNPHKIVLAIILLLLIFILSSLGVSLYYLIVDQGKSKRSLYALIFRIVLSLVLFFLLIFAFFQGFIHPHGIMGG